MVVSVSPAPDEANFPPAEERTHRIVDDQQALDAARQVAVAAAPEAQLRDRQRRYPLQQLALFTQSGLGGISIPRESDSAKLVIDQLSELSAWANAHQGEAAKILSQSTGLAQPIWARALARMPFGSQRMTPAVFAEQQQLADKFTAIGLLPVKVDVSAARWSEDK